MLFAITHAAKHHRHAQIREARKIADRRFHLRGKFPRRLQDQQTRSGLMTS
jgi:hypothetical protein